MKPDIQPDTAYKKGRISVTTLVFTFREVLHVSEERPPAPLRQGLQVSRVLRVFPAPAKHSTAAAAC